MGSTKDMSITVNGQTRVPPGFRFHPTEEELLNYYLRKKVACEKIDLDVIPDVDLNKLEPWELQEKCKIGSTPQNDWYFFSRKDKKYPTGTRTNRATAAGFWKATGRDKVIYTSFKRIGMRKTLVFYKGRAPHGQKSDWIMHEYRLDEHHDSISQTNSCSSNGEPVSPEEGSVICRVFRKKSYHKGLESPSSSSSIAIGKTHLLHPNNDRTLEQILQYMGRSCTQGQETRNSSTVASNGSSHLKYHLPIDVGGVVDKFMKLPNLESPSLPNGPSAPQVDHPCCSGDGSIQAVVNMGGSCKNTRSDWVTLDRLVASHLNSQSEASRQLGCFDDPNCGTFCPAATRYTSEDYERVSNGDIDLWDFAAGSTSSSASDHI